MEKGQVVPSSPCFKTNSVHSCLSTAGGIFNTGSADADFPSEKAVSADSRLANGDDLFELFNGLLDRETITEDKHHSGNTTNRCTVIEPIPPDPTEWMSDSLLMDLLSPMLPAPNAKTVSFEGALTIHHDDSQAVQTAETQLTHITTQPSQVDAGAVATDHLYCAPSPKQAKLEASHTPEEPATTTKYQERRKKNNISSKRSRDSKKARESKLSDHIVKLERENEALRRNAQLLELQIQNMKEQLTIRLMLANGQH